MGMVGAFTSQLGQLFNSQTAGRKMMLMVIVLASVGCMIWLTLRAQSGGYTVLYSNMQPSEAGEALSKLRQHDIKGRMEAGGTTLMVPRNQADEAMVLLSMEGLPNSGSVGFELMDKSTIGQSKFQQEKNYIRMREGEMARTLQSIQKVERARVHLAIPDGSLFVEDEKKPTASVVLRLRPGAKLEEREINGIVHLVSRSIEGLLPENVSVLDQTGNLLSNNQDDQITQFSAAQSNYRIQYEELMKKRIESIIENIVGKGRVAARVQAEFDFASSHEVRETYNPDDQDPIIKTEQVQMDSRAPGAGAGVKGVPGSTSNLPASDNGGAAGTLAAGNGSVSQDRTTEYMVSRKWEETSSSVPKPTKISVALLVDGTYDEIKKNDGSVTKEYRERTSNELMQIENLVKATIGFTNDELRQDLVTIAQAPFQIEEFPADDTPFTSYEMRRYIELGIQWGIVGLIGLLLIFMVLRPAMQQILVAQAPEEPRSQGSIGSNRARIALEEMSKEADMTPERLAELRKQHGLSENLDDEELKKHLLEMQQRGSDIGMLGDMAMAGQAHSKQVHEKVNETAKSNPQKTVSLIRQWMEEA